MTKTALALVVSASLTVTACAAISASTPAAAATPKTAALTRPGNARAPAPAPSQADAAASCAAMKATDVYWITLTDSGDTDQKVEGYPDGTSKVTAAFDYNCIPMKTKMSIIWSIDGEQALSDSVTPKPSDKADTYTYSLFKKDNSVLSNGDYSVEFYLGDTLLTTGKVTVGDIGVSDVTTKTKTTTSSSTSEVTVQGTVADSKSKKAISGAVVVVLNEGVDPKAWLKDGKDEDVLAFAKTDSKGQFELNNQVPTNLALPWIVAAKGYKVILQSDFVIDEGSDDPYIMNIGLERSK
jgi:hypothetical protein